MTKDNRPRQTVGSTTIDTSRPVPGSASAMTTTLDALERDTKALSAHVDTLNADLGTQLTAQGRLAETLLQGLENLARRMDELARAQADMSRTQARETATMRNAVAEFLAQNDVRRDLETERALRETIERRRLEDLARIRQLAEDRDALEIELQGNAARHRREINALRKRSSRPDGPANAVVAPVPRADAPAVAPSAPATSQGLAVLDSAAPLEKAERERLRGDARAAMRARQWDKAEALYATLIAHQGKRPAFWKQYGHAVKEQGKLAQAEQAYFRALALEPGDADTALHLGHVLKNLGKPDHAADIFRGILESRPGFRPARDGLGDLGFPVPPEGLDVPPPLLPQSRVTRWLRRQETSRARNAAKRRDWTTAAARYAAILRKDPRNARLLIQMGHALKEAGRLADAEAAYRKAIEIEPLNSDAHLHLGHALKLGGHIDAAMASYRGALRCWPDNEDARHELQDS